MKEQNQDRDGQLEIDQREKSNWPCRDLVLRLNRASGHWLRCESSKGQLLAFVRNSGFTLVEVILVMVLLGIVVMVTGVMMGRSMDIYGLVGDRTALVSEARYALVRMEKELEGLTDIQSTTATRIGFKDSGGVPTDFNLNATNLYRGSDLLARNISALNFTYYRDTGAITSSAQQTRRIRIDLTITTPLGGSLSLRSDIFPKNFMYYNFR